MLEKLQALYIASKDRRTKWWVKILIAAVLGYALSPIDLIPDFIPVLGYVDDIILPPSRKAAVVIGITWLIALVVISKYLWY